MKKTILAIIAIFFSWAILDFLIHGVILKTAYEKTQEFWRPMMEMKMGLMYSVTAISSISFVLIYSLLIDKKSVVTGLKFGLLFGLSIGISAGYGMYAVMPIPLTMATTWFIGMVVEMLVAGVIVGLIVTAVDTTTQ